MSRVHRYVYVCMYVCIMCMKGLQTPFISWKLHAHTHSRMESCHACTGTCVYVYVSICLTHSRTEPYRYLVCVNVCVYIYIVYVYTQEWSYVTCIVCVSMYGACVCMHTYMHTHICTHTENTYIYTHTYTHIPLTQGPRNRASSHGSRRYLSG